MPNLFDYETRDFVAQFQKNHLIIGDLGLPYIQSISEVHERWNKEETCEALVKALAQLCTWSTQTKNNILKS
jgi:hypothetical protein